MKTYEVTITETLKKRLRSRRLLELRHRNLLKENGMTANISSTPRLLWAWISPHGKKNAIGIMNADLFSVGGKVFGLWGELYAIYQQASPL